VSVPGHRAIEHTADLAVELWAPDEPALLVEGARALVELLTEGAEVGAPTERMAERTLELSAVDPEDRLVRWLSEVLYWASMEGFLVVDAALELVGTTGLRGTVRGQAGAAELVRTEIKAVTYHDLRLERGAAEVRARVVFDV
jgi:SHS2 domain-containing protein